MNVKELMVGNFVRLNKEIDDFKKEIVVVKTIFSFNEASIRDFLDIRYCCIDPEYLDPIPLTVDILKKNGFEMASSEIQKYILWEHKYTVFAMNIYNEAWEIDIFSKECKLPYQSAIVYHIHHLQQWLRFCGIEREIKMSSLTSINTI